MNNLRINHIGVSTCLGIGSDPFLGTSFTDLLAMLESDNNTDKIVLIGEMGGNEEEKAAEYISNNISKPVIGYVAGLIAPRGIYMGHKGAIIEGNSGIVADKIAALESAGVRIARYPGDIPNFLLN
jgi:succinyl-CoA synthetase alpha subunit